MLPARRAWPRNSLHCSIFQNMEVRIEDSPATVMLPVPALGRVIQIGGLAGPAKSAEYRVRSDILWQDELIVIRRRSWECISPAIGLDVVHSPPVLEMEFVSG